VFTRVVKKGNSYEDEVPSYNVIIHFFNNVVTLVFFISNSILAVTPTIVNEVSKVLPDNYFNNEA
jgi:hypothetical protein